jgi:hypothetical protein
LRLKYIAARSYALMGDHSSVQEAINLAQRDRDQAEDHPDELSRSVGGEFEFGEAGLLRVLLPDGWTSNQATMP